MKKKLLLLLLCLITGSLFAQLKIKGFGKLKLDSPISIIYDMGKKIIPINSSTEYSYKVYKKYTSKDIFELKADTTQTYMVSNSSVNKRIRVFVIPKYKVMKGITMSGVRLRFYDDKLISVHCDTSEGLEDAITTKYGKPTIDIRKEEKIFTNSATGRKVVKEDAFYTTSWSTYDSVISCESRLIQYHDDEGEANYIKYTYLSNSIFDKQIRKSEDSIKKAIKIRKLMRDRKELDKF